MTEMYRIEKRWTPEGVEMLKRENPNFKNQSVLNGEWVPFKFGKADLGSLTKEKAEEWLAKLQDSEGHVEVRMVPEDGENIQETLNESKQKLRTEMLAGIITETKYREECEKLTLTESKTSNKKSLKENISYPDVINGNSIPKKEKTLNEGDLNDSRKKWIEASIAHIHELDKNGRFGWGDLENLRDIIEDAWWYVENGDKKYQKSLEKLLGYKLPKLTPPLNENISYPEVINGNSTPKKDYEMAFEHFIGSKLNENEENVEETDLNEGRTDEFFKILETVWDDAVESVDYDQEHGYSSKSFQDYISENRGKLSAMLSKL